MVTFCLSIRTKNACFMFLSSFLEALKILHAQKEMEIVFLNNKVKIYPPRSWRCVHWLSDSSAVPFVSWIGDGMTGVVNLGYCNGFTLPNFVAEIAG